MPQSEGYGGLKFCASVFVQGKPAKESKSQRTRQVSHPVSLSPAVQRGSSSVLTLGMRGCVQIHESCSEVSCASQPAHRRMAVQIAHHRVIVRHALGQHSEMAKSLLDALEGSLRIFEKHRIFLLSSIVNRPSKRIIQTPRPAD